jgi:hypothetical protein
MAVFWVVVPCATAEKTAIFSVLEVLKVYHIPRIIGPQLKNKEAKVVFNIV